MCALATQGYPVTGVAYAAAQNAKVACMGGYSKVFYDTLTLARQRESCLCGRAYAGATRTGCACIRNMQRKICKACADVSLARLSKQFVYMMCKISPGGILEPSGKPPEPPESRRSHQNLRNLPESPEPLSGLRPLGKRCSRKNATQMGLWCVPCDRVLQLLISAISSWSNRDGPV